MECSVCLVITNVSQFHGHASNRRQCHAEAEAILLDGLKITGPPSQVLRDVVIDVSEQSASRARGDLSRPLKPQTPKQHAGIWSRSIKLQWQSRVGVIIKSSVASCSHARNVEVRRRPSGSLF